MATANPTANYYDLSGPSTRIAWYPEGRGGPVVAGGLPPGAPVLIYYNGSTDVVVSGDKLQQSSTLAGTFVVANVTQGPQLPGRTVCICVLFPDVSLGTAPVAVQTYGLQSIHREVNVIGPGQLETYTTIALSGTASHILMPL
jgi:hypothetical protein